MSKFDPEFGVGGIFRLGRKIGSGSFGAIHLGINIHNGAEVAIKLESLQSKPPQLAYEYKVYRILAGGVGIPNVHWFGREEDFNVLVMDILGPSLEELFTLCSRKFSLRTVLMLADQLIARIEYVHAKQFLHRDIKPDNFVVGFGERRDQVYVIDFGLSKKYRTRAHEHIPYVENKSLTGTARYASLNTHLGIEQSRRDDLESLGFLLIYFLCGSLPWQGLKAHTMKEKYNRIKIKKRDTPVEVLCEGLPGEFATYLHYCRALRFEEKPDYAYLRAVFRNLFYSRGLAGDYRFDWMMLSPPRSIVEEHLVDQKMYNCMKSKRSDDKKKYDSRIFEGYISTKPEDDYNHHHKFRVKSNADPHVDFVS